LHLCAQIGSIPLFLYIKDKVVFDLEAVDSRGLNLLDISIAERREEFALLILSICPELLKGQNKGDSALELAVDIGSYRITRHILMNKSSFGESVGNIKRLKGKCDDKDILRLLVKHRQGQNAVTFKSPRFFIVLIIAMLARVSYRYAGFSSLIFGSNRSLDALIEESSEGAVVLCLFVLGFIVAFTNPGFDDPKYQTTLIVTFL
jgi:hypothetical protein